LRDDAHIAALAREVYSLTILYVDFLSTGVMNLTKYFLLTILSLALPYEDVEVGVDDFDASLVFENKPLTPVRERFREPLSEKEFTAAKQQLMVRYGHMLEKQPALWGTEVVRLATTDIYYIDLLGLINMCTYEMFVELYTESRMKIAEAQIVFRKGK
jgi:hypothetical protein